jgi:hypothetical protein
MLRERNSSRISEERGDPSLNSQRENFLHGSLRRTPILECSERNSFKGLWGGDPSLNALSLRCAGIRRTSVLFLCLNVWEMNQTCQLWIIITIHDSFLAHLCCCSQKAPQHVGKLAKETEQSWKLLVTMPKMILQV